MTKGANSGTSSLLQRSHIQRSKIDSVLSTTVLVCEHSMWFLFPSIPFPFFLLLICKNWSHKNFVSLCAMKSLFLIWLSLWCYGMFAFWKFNVTLAKECQWCAVKILVLLENVIIWLLLAKGDLNESLSLVNGIDLKAVIVSLNLSKHVVKHILM